MRVDKAKLHELLRKNHPELLIMVCPYCASSDVHETCRVSGHAIEVVWAACLSCNEEFRVERDMTSKEDEEE